MGRSWVDLRSLCPAQWAWNKEGNQPGNFPGHTSPNSMFAGQSVINAVCALVGMSISSCYDINPQTYEGVVCLSGVALLAGSPLSGGSGIQAPYILWCHHLQLVCSRSLPGITLYPLYNCSLVQNSGTCPQIHCKFAGKYQS